MSEDVQVRFCERLGVRLPRATHLVLIHRDRRYLLECRKQMSEFLRNSLCLNLHPKKFYLQHYSKGVPFLGVFIKPYRIYIGRRSKSNFYRLVSQWNMELPKKEGHVAMEDLSIYRSKINSYLGMLSHYNTHKLREKVMHQTLDKSFRQHFVVPASLRKVILNQRSRVSLLQMIS